MHNIGTWNIISISNICKCMCYTRICNCFSADKVHFWILWSWLAFSLHFACWVSLLYVTIISLLTVVDHLMTFLSWWKLLSESGGLCKNLHYWFEYSIKWSAKISIWHDAPLCVQFCTSYLAIGLRFCKSNNRDSSEISQIFWPR